MAGSDATAIGRDLRLLFDGGSLAAAGDGELLARYARGGPGAPSAFEAIVDRHGPAVLVTCRRVAGDSESAQDVFQATFLVLARKAGSVQVRDSLRPWLLEVARRTALKAQTGERRRWRRERKVATPEATSLPPTIPDELGPIVRAEVDRLPPKYRDPVRLFYFEGRTQEETARALGWPLGSVSGRLFQARALLRSRLSKRGVAPLGWLAGAGLAEAEAAIPPALRLATLALATARAAGPPAPIALAGRVLRRMALARIAAGAAGLALAAATLGVGVGLLLGHEKEPEPAPAAPVATVPAAVAPGAGVDRPLDDALIPPGATARLGPARFRQGYFDDGHRMTGAFYSPDGRSLVTVGTQGGVSIWEASTGRRVRRVEGKQAGLSPDGRVLATAQPGLLRLWDFPTGRELRRVELGPREEPRMLAYAPDGSRLVALTVAPPKSRPGQLEVALVGFDAGTLAERFRRPGEFLQARALAFAPGGKLLAMAVPDEDYQPMSISRLDEPDRSWVVLFDAADGSEVRRIVVDRFGVGSVAFSPDGSTLAAGIGDRTIRLYDPATGQEKLPRLNADDAMPAPGPGDSARKWYEGGARGYSALAFSPDGSKLASGQELIGYLKGRVDEAAITLWDVAARRPIRRSFGHYGGVSGLTFAPDGRTFASAGGETVAKVWDGSTGLEVDPSPRHRGDPHLLAVSPGDGSVFTAGGHDHKILHWDPMTGRGLGAVDVPAEALAIDPTPDGSGLLVDTGESLMLLDLDSGKEIRRFIADRPSTAGFHRVRFSPDGRTVTTELKVWEVDTGRLLARFDGDLPDWWVNTGNLSTHYTPDGRRLVSVESTGVRVLDIASGTVVSTPILREIADPTRSALSPDGRRVALGNFAPMLGGGTGRPAPDLPVRVHDLATGREVASLVGHTDQISAVAFSPDGRLIATSAGDQWHTNDRTVRVWDASSGRELKRFDVPENGAGQVAFLPDGRSIVSLGMDGSAVVWDLGEVAMRP